MKPHDFGAGPRHAFRGEDAARFCGHLSPDGEVCVEERGHALHRYVVDPEEVLVRRMLGSRRDYRDVTEGNSTLRDHGI
jgi:hypothetical protein